MIAVLGYILFGLMFIALPLALVVFAVVAVLDFIDEIKFIRKNKMDQEV
jgi:hypothetical protein